LSGAQNIQLRTSVPNAGHVTDPGSAERHDCALREPPAAQGKLTRFLTSQADELRGNRSATLADNDWNAI
jgi:hypothetical protein